MKQYASGQCRDNKGLVKNKLPKGGKGGVAIKLTG